MPHGELIQVKDVSAASRCYGNWKYDYVWRDIVAQTTIAYLERRYLALGNEIANALHQSPTDDLAIADLNYRKLIIADEIHHVALLNVFRKH